MVRASADALIFDAEGSKALLEQVLTVWVNPEIERRRSAGTWTDGFTLHGAQIIMNIGEAPKVRLNDEVKGVLAGVCARAVEKGECVGWDALSEVKELFLTNQDPDAGHITLLRIDNQFAIFFDCRYNATKVGKHLDAAGEFLGCATHARDKNYQRAFAENLFGAAELIAKSLLMLMPDERVLQNAKHGYIAAELNRRSKLRPLQKDFVQLFNELGPMRHTARYVRGDPELGEATMTKMLATVSDALGRVREDTPRRV